MLIDYNTQVVAAIESYHLMKLYDQSSNLMNQPINFENRLYDCTQEAREQILIFGIRSTKIRSSEFYSIFKDAA